MLLSILGDACIILRIPMVFGSGCPRIRGLRSDAQKGAQVRSYTDLYVNITTDTQIAAFIAWLIKIRGNGIYHTGSTDWITYDELLRKLCERMGLANVSFTGENNETKEYLGVSSVRNGIPDNLKLTINQLLESMDYNIGGQI